MRRKTRKQQPKLSSDSLLKTSKQGKISEEELDDEKLDEVVGGMGGGVINPFPPGRG